MFTPARYVVLDDEESELTALVDALHVLGAPCIGIRFDPEGLPSPSLFAGVRILFSDLHLVKAQPAGVTHYNTLANLLDHCLPDRHGPYLLVLWTSHEHERTALTARLEELLPASKRPLAVLALDKVNFLTEEGWDGESLRAEIGVQLASIPQLQALLSWERDVLAAANETLGLLGGLISDEDRTVGSYPAALDRILGLLAVAAAGASNAASDRRGAVNGAMFPLLGDRILNRPQDPDANALWQQAVTFESLPDLTPLQKGRMNRMLHLAIPPGEPVNRLDWGAVIPLDEALLTDEAMQERFGATAAQIRENEFKLKQSRRTDGQLVVIRGGAACDQAQGQAGPIPLLLGLLVPIGALADKKRSPAIHLCDEIFELDGYAEPLRLMIHARFGTTIVSSALQAWPEPLMRVREQLLTTILVHVATHAMRPGTLRF